MSKSVPLISSFNGGEVSPKMSGRVDIDKYYSSCLVMENMMPTPLGSATSMPGTYYVAKGKLAGKKVRLIEFCFSTIQTYQLEFGDKYIRFYKNNGQIVVAYSAWLTTTDYVLGNLVFTGTPTKYYRCLVAHTAGVFATDLAAGYWEETEGATDLAYEIPSPYLEADLFDLMVRQQADVMYIWHDSYSPRKLTRTAHTTWTLTEPEFLASGLTITNITNANPAVVTFSGTHDFLAGEKLFITGVEGMTEVNDTTFTAGSTGYSNTIKLSGVDSSSYSVYIEGGNAYRAITAITKANPAVVSCYKHGFSNGDRVYIRHVVGMTELNGNTYTVANKTINGFQLSGVNSSSYSAYSAGGSATLRKFYNTDDYPSCGAFFEQRLMQGGTVNNPQTVYGSASDDPENYVKIPDDVSAAIEYTLPGSGKVDKIRWMVAQGQLIMGTYGSIQKLGASDGSGLSMENVKADLQVSVGVKGIDAILTNDSIVFVMRDGQSLREVFYDYLSDKFLSPPDITLLAEHIARGSTKALSGITDMAYQQSPQSILWAVRTDGQLLGMAYEKSQKVYGWFRWKTKGIVESVSVYTNDGDEDEIWVSVKRTINDVDYRYIEYFKPHEIYSDITQAFYVDSGLTFDGGAAVTDISAISKANPCVVTHTGHHGFIDGQKIRITEVIGMSEINQERTSAYTVANATDHTYELSGVDSTGWGTYTSGGQAQVVAQTLTGLDHLEGESVSIITDGSVHPNATVTSGSITLAWYGNLIHAGLYSRRILAPMPINSGAPDGTPHGRTKKISNITIDFYETWGGKVVQKLADIDDPQKCETIAFGTGTSPTLFSGFKDVNAPGEYNKDGTLYIVQDVPLPMTINSITVRMDTYD